MQEDLTAETTKKVLDAFAKGEKPKPGPQSGRHTSENSAGLTALTEKVRLRPAPHVIWQLTLGDSRTAQGSTASRSLRRVRAVRACALSPWESIYACHSTLISTQVCCAWVYGIVSVRKCVQELCGMLD